MSSQRDRWVPMSTAPSYRRAQNDILEAARRDCEASSASRAAFGPHLTAFDQAWAAQKTLPRPAADELPPAPREYHVYVSGDWHDTFHALVDEIRADCMVSSASAELFGPLLERFDAETAEIEQRVALSDTMDSVAAFLKTSHALDYAMGRGSIDERTIMAALQYAVETHESPRVAPLAWEAKGNGIEWAHTPFGVYEIVDFGARGFLLQFGIGASSFLIHEAPGSSRDQVAELARADYARRVRNCMSPPANVKLVCR
jgi:hypothetical protein